jgi:hypothetical protein
MADFPIGEWRKASDLPPQSLHRVKRDGRRRRTRSSAVVPLKAIAGGASTRK